MDEDGEDPDRAVTAEPEAAAVVLLTSAHLLHTSDGKGFDVELELEVSLCDLFLGKTKKVTFDATDADGLSCTRTVRVRLDEYGDRKEDRRDVVVFRGAGHDSPWPGVRPGDAWVHIRVTPHPYVQRDDVLHTPDLFTTVRVTPHDFYYGGQVRWTHVDGRTLVIRYPARGRTSSSASSSSSSELFHGTVLKGEGLPRPRRRNHQSVRRHRRRRRSDEDENEEYSDDDIGEEEEEDDDRGVLVVYFEVSLPTLTDAELDGYQVRWVMRKLFECKTQM